MKKIAIIPARGGSKRIPRKNIRPFYGKPIIQYSIDAAFDSGLFDEVMVSTDDPKIAELAEKLGASVPFYRKPETSGDKCGLAEVILEVIDSYESIGKTFDFGCCIFATAPFISKNRLVEAFEKMINEKFDSVFPLVSYSVPIQQAFKILPEDGKVEMFFDEQAGIMTQDYTPSYYDAGQFYWMRLAALKKYNRIDSKNSGAIILPEFEAQDIDSEDDWIVAEQKYYYVQNKLK